MSERLELEAVEGPPDRDAIYRSQGIPGMIVAGDVVTTAFADAGWAWGGDWTNTSDWQHFSHNGR